MIIEKLVKGICRKRYHSLLQNLDNYQAVQTNLKEQLFEIHQKSRYGQYVRPKQWEEIPIVSYQEIAPWLSIGDSNYVETSGSTSRSKKIPCTSGLKNSFLSLFKIWAYDLLQHVLKPGIGKIFMSLSPPTHTGLKDDTQYLNPLLRKLLKPFLILPPVNQPEHYAELVARALLAAKDLGIISIWNPTYLLQIMEYIETHRERFADLVAPGAIDWQALWPKLQLISCWTDGWAKAQARSLKSKFPHVPLQGKGLLATEAPISVPLHHAPAPVPLIDEVYFEFRDAACNILNLGQVCQGQCYELIISQKGGLIRYSMQDLVKVSGYFHSTPCLTFMGRVGMVCDMVGEKLDAVLVEEALKACQTDGMQTLLPIYATGTRCHYLLLSESRTADLSVQLEEQLQKIYYYRAARLTDQLGKVEECKVENLRTKLHQFDLKRGMNLGDIKERHFISDPTLAAELLTFLEKN